MMMVNTNVMQCGDISRSKGLGYALGAVHAIRVRDTTVLVLYCTITPVDILWITIRSAHWYTLIDVCH